MIANLMTSVIMWIKKLDARIGGWLSPDPYKQHFSPYMAMSNNPLSFIDPDGGMDGDIGGDGSDIHISEFGGEFGLDDPLGYAHDRYNNGNAGQRYLHKSGGLSASYSNWEQFGTSRNNIENTTIRQEITTTTRALVYYTGFSLSEGFVGREIYFSSTTTTKTITNNGYGPGKNLSVTPLNIATITGTFAGVSEMNKVSDGMWYSPKTKKWHPEHVANGATGPRKPIQKSAKNWNRIGKGLFYLSAIYSISDLTYYFATGGKDYKKLAYAGVDVGVGAIATWGGIPGMAIGTAYFLGTMKIAPSNKYESININIIPTHIKVDNTGINNNGGF